MLNGRGQGGQIMANTWAAIGRAQPHKYAGELLQNKLAIEQNERQGLLTQSKLALDNVEYQKMQNELTRQKQEQERLSKPVNIKAHPMFLGLSDDMKKRVFDHFFDGGLVDEQGIGTTGDVMFGIQTIEQTTKGLKTILAPAIEEQQGELLRRQTEIAEMKVKGGNPKQIETKQQELADLAAKFNQSSIVYKNALEQAQKIELEQVKEKERIKLQGIKDKEDAKAAQLKADALAKSQELQRKNVLEAARIRSSGAGEKPTKKEKKLIDLKADFKYNLSQYNSATRGVGQYIPDENKEKVAKESFDRMEVLAKEYKNSGGDPADLGIDVEPQKKTSTELPEMPPAKDHKGKTIRDTQTNKRYTSNGKAWVEIK